MHVQVAEEGLAQGIVVSAGCALLAPREAEAEQRGEAERRYGAGNGTPPRLPEASCSIHLLVSVRTPFS